MLFIRPPRFGVGLPSRHGRSAARPAPGDGAPARATHARLFGIVLLGLFLLVEIAWQSAEPGAGVGGIPVTCGRDAGARLAIAPLPEPASGSFGTLGIRGEVPAEEIVFRTRERAFAYESHPDCAADGHSQPTSAASVAPSGPSPDATSIPAHPASAAQAPGFEVSLSADSPSIRVKRADAAFGFSMTALGFESGPAEPSGGMVSYRHPSGMISAVYRPNAQGVKEDIVLERPEALLVPHPMAGDDGLALTWRLDLPPELESRLESDGSVGLYGPDPLLSGEIQIGDEKSRELVQRARRAAPKTQRLYTLPAPVIREAGGRLRRDLARFDLAGDRIHIRLAAAVSRLSYPISIDPSVVITTTVDFQTGGNNEGHISIGGNQITRNELTAGRCGSWSGTTSLPVGYEGHATLASNGTLYVIGGNDGGVGYYNTTRYATINPADGTIGAWSAGTTMTTPRAWHGLVAWNGFMYALGGFDGSVYLNSVEVAAINPADGSLSAWSTTTAFAGIRGQHAAVAHNGFIYVIGGRDTTPGSAFNDVQYALLKANGTIGAWSTTSTLPAGRYAGGAAAYNGRLYFTGGDDGTGSAQAGVSFSVQNFDGTLNGWTAAATMAIAREQHGCVVHNGYLYALSGFDGVSRLTSIAFAPISPNGDLGAWGYTSSLATGRQDAFSATYNGYLYVIAGYGGATMSDVQMSKIEGLGTIGGWAATNTFTTARQAHATVAYNGCLYVLGGAGAGAPQNDVQYASIGPSGSVGVWSTTSPFSNGRKFLAAVAHDGYLYVLGGLDPSSIVLNDVQVAPINANGSVGTWTGTTSFASARQGLSAAAHNGYLYVLGGFDGTSTWYNDVQYAPIGAGGTVGSWTATSPFTTGREEHATVAYNGFLYVIGGADGLGPMDDVQYALMNANGTVGAWNTTTVLPSLREGHAAAAYNGFLYVLGGYDNLSEVNSVESAPINANGTLGSFTATTSFPTARTTLTGAAANGYLYVLGGFSSGPNYYNSVHGAPIDVHGTLGTWAAGANFTTARWGHASVAYDGYLYVLGGNGGAPGPENDVQYAAIQPDGSILAWNPTSSMTSGRQYFPAVAHKGYMYAFGGDNAGVQNSVEFATINPNGTLSAWSLTNSFTTARQGHSAVGLSGRVYILGGFDGAGYLNDVQLATIGGTGTLGAWSGTTSFTTARTEHSSFVYNGRVYVVGGANGSGPMSSVESAAISVGGSVGPWTAETSFGGAREGHSAVAWNGHAFVIAGWNGSVYYGDVQASPLNDGGSLPAWGFLQPFPSPRRGHGTAVSGGFIYVTGGEDGSFQNDVRYAPIRTPVQSGIYSRRVDLGSHQTIDSITINGSSANLGEVRLQYRLADAPTATFGPEFVVDPVALGTPIAVGSSGRYVQVRLTLDDTGTAAVNADATNARDVTDVTINYSADVTAPTVLGVHSTIGEPVQIGIGSTVQVYVEFSEFVTLTGGNLMVSLDTGGTVTIPPFGPSVNASGTYTVGAGHVSADLNAVSPLTLSAGTLQDGGGNNAVLTIPGGMNLADSEDITVDGIAPTISSVTSSTANGSYTNGASVDVTVNFSEQVILAGGNLLITLDTGGGVTIPPFGPALTASGTYSVGALENSADLNATSPLSLSAGTLRDAVSNNAVLTIPGGQNIADLKAIVIDNTSPAVTSVTSSSLNGTYGLGDSVDVTVNFSEPVTLAGGNLQVTLDTGDVITIAPFGPASSASGTYVVGAGDNSLDLNATSPLTLSGGTLQDAVALPCSLTIPGGQNIADLKALVIDTTAPGVVSVSSSTSDATYGIGASINVTVTFDEAVTLAGGNLQVALSTGDVVSIVPFGPSTTASGTYTVGVGDVSADLNATSPLTLSGGTLMDAGDNPAGLTIPGGQNIADLKALVIDGVAPAVSSLGSPNPNATYGPGANLTIQVFFTEAVTLSGGNLQVTLDTGDVVVIAPFGSAVSASGTYVVGAGDTSADLTATSPLTLSAGTLADGAGNACTLTIPGGFNLGDAKAIVIDTTAPSVSSVTSSTGNGSYGLAANINVTVNFSESVTLAGGNLQVALDTGAMVSIAPFGPSATASGTYVVGAAQNSADLTATSPLTLSGGTLQDAGGNSTTLTIPAGQNIADLKAIVVDTGAPTITSVTSSTANGTYGTTSSINITVNFSEAVTLAGGTLRVTLDTGDLINIAPFGPALTASGTYIVGPGDLSSDLNAASPLSLLGGTLQDAAGNPASLSIPGGQNIADLKAIAVDGVPPSNVGDLAVTTSTSNTLTLTWTATGDDAGVGTAASYDIRYSTSGPILTGIAFSSATPVSGEPTPSASGSPETMIVTGLSPNTTYYFQIEVYDDAGNSGLTIGSSPSGMTRVGAPTNLSAAAGNGSLSLSWDVVPGAVGYTLYYDVDYGQPYTGVGASGGPSPIDVLSSNSYVLSGLSNGVTYYVAVRGYQAGVVEGDYSSELYGTPVPTSSVTPTRALTGASTLVSQGQPAQRAYRMVGWPVTPGNSDPLANLEDDLGPYNTTVWRMYGYGSGAYVEITASPQPILPGRGFWLITSEDMTIDVSGTLPNTAQDYVINLQPGWNLVSDPFDFNVDWADCKANGTNIFGGQSVVGVELWDYNGGGSYDLATKLASGRAYFVKNLTGSSVSLAVPPIVGSTKPIVPPAGGFAYASSGPPPEPPGGFGTTSSSGSGGSGGSPPPPPGATISSGDSGSGGSGAASSSGGGGGGGGGCYSEVVGQTSVCPLGLLALAFLVLGLGLWFAMDRAFRGV